MNIFKAITDYQKVQFSTFDFGNTYTGSVNDFGSLNFCYGTTVLPGDSWKMGHNLMVKLPPLVAPAFTRIKGIINTFYVKYSSVWKYWNSFISDRPEDAFLSRSAASAYRGKFVEPRVPMAYIAIICKIAKGWCNVVDPNQNGNFEFTFFSAQSTYDFSAVPYTLTWSTSSLASSSRIVTVTSNLSSLTGLVQQDNAITPGTNPLKFDVSQFTQVYTDFSQVVGSDAMFLAQRLGFARPMDYLIYCCQQVVRNLENLGLPCDLIARSSVATYLDDFFNVMPLLCLSSAWHNFYRSEQNQAPEFDYREVNGSIAPLSLFRLQDGTYPYSGSSFVGNSTPSGWWLKLNGIPPSVSSQSDYWYRITTFEEVFSVLTGCYLDVVLLGQKSALFTSTVDNVNILPTFYNGLMFLKYRNFEDDFFTSASVDPNLGGVSVNVPATIDALRTASKFEEFLERGIARDFVTWMQMQYGEKPTDDYDNPLLLGTQVCPIQIGEQLQTSETTSSSPLGERAGTAEGYSNSGTANHKFREHGFIFSLLSFVIDSQYKDGMPREFLTHKQLDYPFPAFANLGAETINTKEIYYGDSYDYHRLSDNQGNPVVIKHGTGSNYDSHVVSPDPSAAGAGLQVDPESNLDVTIQETGGFSIASVPHYRPTSFFNGQKVFGYTPRYSRWKFKMDVVAGQMRESLDYWHTFREFFQTPYIGHNFVSYLNASFINNINRIFAVVNDNADKFYVYCFNNASVRRCLPLIPDTTLD